MFIQLVQFETDRIEDMRRRETEFREKSKDRDPGVRRSAICADRDHPNRYVAIVEFESYEQAMANSEHPDTQEFAKGMMELSNGPAQFINLDVIEVAEPTPA